MNTYAVDLMVRLNVTMVRTCVVEAENNTAPSVWIIEAAVPPPSVPDRCVCVGGSDDAAGYSD